MTAEDFSSRLCAELIRRKAFVEDSQPHRMIESVARNLFPGIAAELRGEWEKELAGEPVPSGLPSRVTAH